MSAQDDQVIRDFLTQRGHSSDEIEKILVQLAQYENATLRKSVFDSIDAGGFDIDRIIKETLGD
jgi:hypothetical protein